MKRKCLYSSEKLVVDKYKMKVINTVPSRIISRVLVIIHKKMKNHLLVLIQSIRIKEV
tara:strand:- start:250 stop:423 length:174 start_codon:yes stop_codon:yes gene_type:complete